MKKVLTVRFDLLQYNELQVLANSNKTTKSKLIRLAVLELLQRLNNVN